MIEWQEMAKFGKKLVERGLVESHFGNMSVRAGSRMLITKSGVPLDEINEDSIMVVDIDKPSGPDGIASSESPIHRAIYKNTTALAVIHAHPAFSVVESLLGHDKIIPPDSEGQYILHEIPVVRGGFGSKELADNTSGALKDHKGVIVFGHGTFAAGKTIEEAYFVTAQIEHSCKLKYYCDLARRIPG